MTKENLLVTLADKNYIKQAKQLFSSVYWNAGWKGDYMLLAHEIPEKELRWFRKKGILVKKCKPLYNKKINGYLPVVLDKFYLFTPEFKKWKNIIYLDADIIVRASLDELTKVKGFASPRVSGMNQPLKDYFLRNGKSKKMRLLKKIYNLNRPAFNSGVMVFSTKTIKRDTFWSMISLLDKYKSLALGDDPIINLLFYRKWKELPLVYDILPRHLIDSFKLYFSDIKGIILHFISQKKKDKPWHPENPFYKEWKNNLERAELIDLNNIPEGKKWSRFEIYKYSFCFKKKGVFYTFLKRQKNNFIYLLNTPDRLLGKFGIFLKKHNAGLYHKLKRIEKKIRK